MRKFIIDLFKSVIVSFVLVVTTIVGVCTAGYLWERFENVLNKTFKLNKSEEKEE